MKLSVTPQGIGTMLLAEAIVSLYPIVARLSTLPTLFQSALRAIVLSVSLLPIILNVNGAFGEITSWSWVFAGVTNLLHIYSSFKGFAMTPTGPALSVFFTYPLISIIMASLYYGDYVSIWSWVGIIMAFGGVLWMNLAPDGPLPGEKESEWVEGKVEPIPQPEPGGLRVTWEGIFWLLVSAITEATIYIFVLHGGDILDNPLVSVFATNFWAAIPLLLYYVYDYIKAPEKSPIVIAPKETGALTLANLVVGIGGLGLTFAAARMLPPGVYGVLVYTGVLFGFLYGFGLGDRLHTRDIVGSLMIVAGSILGGRGR
jgi:drug/metabolite transporter (DMT)-like permease